MPRTYSSPCDELMPSLDIDKDQACPYSSPSFRVSEIYAVVVELVDTLASGASGRKAVKVQVLSSVPHANQPDSK